MPTKFLHGFAPPAADDFITIVRAEGCTLWDDQGKRYLDALASLWYCQVGHGRAEIIDAVADQMRLLDAYQTFAPFTNQPAEELASLVVERSPHPDGRVFFGGSGSEAVDSALKIARAVHQLRGEPDRQIIIRRTDAYHGTNFGGTSAQGIAGNREGWGDLVPHFIEVPRDDIEAVSTTLAANEGRVAAIITEPVQGAGGVYPPSDGYLEGLRRLCDQHGALLIIDEVICGFGRTGSWFGAQHYGVMPDLMTFAKGVTSGYQPVGGVICSRAVCDVLEEPGYTLRTGYTYAGHPTCMAAGVANLALMEKEQLVQRVPHLAEKLTEGLAALQADGIIHSYRGTGAVYAAELGYDAAAARMRLLEAGVVLRPVGTGLAICPPLVITDHEIGILFDTMADVLSNGPG
ncbi:MAG: aminotransferase class III-fold pyridoxal phosphate-dependent enzyme [bacterium]|nr:aminotransferase class III-fold pyridoxal phosphate-dependent enzyme [bacterium]